MLNPPRQTSSNVVASPSEYISVDVLHANWRTVADYLLDQRCAEGKWIGELSTSALSTATAVSALVQMRRNNTPQPALRPEVDSAIESGVTWLARHQNQDGGFGDTDRSHSNIATTLLVIAAWELAEFRPSFRHASERSATSEAWAYVESQGGWGGLRKRYGKDKTFVVPILCNCAIAGLVSWDRVPPLPFEAACLPQAWYRLARMPVVSYAVPALVAIGQARFHQQPPRNPLVRWLRRVAARPTLNVLRRMQPASGGYLEATPLTSFVLMSLAIIGEAESPVAKDCLKFVLNSRLRDGSWPIDTNLATWVTSLSLLACSRATGKLPLEEHSCAPDGGVTFPADDERRVTSDAPPRETRDDRVGAVKSYSGVRRSDSSDRLQLLGKWFLEPKVVRWLLACQHRHRHPFTGANPGGWGWTNLSGAVPDADDTPAALLVLRRLDVDPTRFPLLCSQIDDAVLMGLQWLLRLQNRDGGWPTFCRGWGKLPFDRSGTDLTAHALRALHAWRDDIPRLVDASKRLNARSGIAADRLARLVDRAIARGLKYLAENQQPDGSWLPLWFGNQDRIQEDNPVYGTGKVILAYAELGLQDLRPCQLGLKFLRRDQNQDGGWGGGASLSEGISVQPGLSLGASQAWDACQSLESHHGVASTESLPTGACDSARSAGPSSLEETAVAVDGLLACAGTPTGDATIMRGLSWMSTAIEAGRVHRAWPIGFYFAKLWYYEKLYPAIFSLSALGAAVRYWESSDRHGLVPTDGEPAS